MESVSLEDLLGHLASLLTTAPPGFSRSDDGDGILPASVPALPAAASTVAAEPAPLASVAAYLGTHVLPHLNRGSLAPNYYGFVTGGVAPAALLADWLVGVWDQNVQVHLPAETIATGVEVAALNQLVHLLNLPHRAWGVSGNAGTPGGGGGGTFTTGATASNILGLALGREWVLQRAAERKSGGGSGSKAVSCGEHGVFEAMLAAGVTRLKLLTTLPHSSIGKAASVLGIGRASIVSVAAETDGGGGDQVAIDLDKLQREIAEDGTACVLVLSAGEVNTGSFATGGIETVRRIRAMCDRHNVWIHVDGAFGLFARILMGTGSEEDDDDDYGEIVNGVDGLELADSITGDCHKLLQVPYDCGFFLCRHRDMAARVCANSNAAYLTSAASSSADGRGDGIQSPLNIGLENSRRFRALPVHAALCTYGRAGYVDMLKRQIALARRVVRWLWHDRRYEVLPTETADLAEAVARTFIVVLFRAKDDALNSALAKRINGTGRMYVTGTTWQGRTAVRIAVSNWRVDVERDARLIEETLDTVARIEE